MDSSQSDVGAHDDIHRLLSDPGTSWTSILKHTKDEATLIKVIKIYGYKVDAVDRDDRTLLSVAITNGFLNIVDMLLPDDSSGINYLHSKALLAAVVQGQRDVVGMLLNKGVDINQPHDEQGWGSTALHFAALQKDKAMVEYLLNKGADPTKKNNYLGRPKGDAQLPLNLDGRPLELRAQDQCIRLLTNAEKEWGKARQEVRESSEVNESLSKLAIT